MSRKTQITLTDRQYAFLRAEAERSGLSLAELIRRAVDGWFRPHIRPKVKGWEVAVGAWKRPDAALVGRRLRGGAGWTSARSSARRRLRELLPTRRDAARARRPTGRAR